MRSHTVTAVLPAPKREVFAYISAIENLPDWATEFARELRREDDGYRVVNNLVELRFEIRADAETGVIDMLAGRAPRRWHSSPPERSSWPMGAPPSCSRCSKARGCRMSSSRASTSR
jgi:hypothetical protein